MPAPLQILRHESALGHWEMVRRAPPPALAGLVAGTYCGWTESMSPGPIRRELPTTKIPVIFNFGASYRIGGAGASIDDAEPLDSFVAGPYESFAETQSTGPTSGVQVDLTPLGAYRLLGMPLADIAGRGAPLEDVLPDGRTLVPRLAEARGWEARFRIIDEALLAGLARAREPARPVVEAWRRLESTGGNTSIGSLASAAGWSRKHLIESFRRHLGMAPKRLARVLRFGRFSERLHGAAKIDWISLALDSGYYDQAHLIRDCHDFAGCTPRGLLARRLPEGGWLGGSVESERRHAPVTVERG